MCAETHARSAPPLLALLTSCARLADAFLVRCGSCDALFSFLSMARPGMARPRMARPRMARMACQGMASDGKVPSCGNGRCLPRSAGVSARRQRDRRALVSSRSHVHLQVMRATGCPPPSRRTHSALVPSRGRSGLSSGPSFLVRCRNEAGSASSRWPCCCTGRHGGPSYQREDWR